MLDRQFDAIQGDGNSIFSSISKELLGCERQHTTLRNVLVNYNPGPFKFFLFDETMEDHCTSGSQMELQALSCLLQVSVCLFSRKRRLWIWMEGIQASVSAKEQAKGIEKLDRPELIHKELCHTIGMHFDRVVPQNLYSKCEPAWTSTLHFYTPPQQQD